MTPTSPSDPGPPSRVVLAAAHLANALLVVLCGVLVAMSWYGFAVRCEGFGCLGKGLWWMLWTAVAVTSGVVALIVWAWQGARGLGTRVSGFAVLVLAALAVGHLVYWMWATAPR